MKNRLRQWLLDPAHDIPKFVFSWLPVIVFLLTFAFGHYAFAGEGDIHFKSGAVCSSGSTTKELPPGYYLTETSFDALAKEFKRLQEQEIRLQAELESLKVPPATQLVTATTKPFKVIFFSGTVGVIGGALLVFYLTR